MYKKVGYGKDAREKILAGINKITDAISVTLGPSGRNVVIAQVMVVDYGIQSYPLHITKDGVTVARAFELDDPFEKVGVMAVKEAAQKTVDQAGDGTTTTAVLLRAIVVEGLKLINAGANPMELKESIDEAVRSIVYSLSKMAVPIKGDVEKIRQIATVSANNDASIGDLIAQAFEKIGDEGVIDVEASTSVHTEIKIGDGYKFGNGWSSPYFISNKEKQSCEYVDPFILLYEKKITHHTQVEKVLAAVNQNYGSRPVLIICEGADEQGLAFLALNNFKGTLKCCVVKSPSFGDRRREEMEDIATLTGAVYVSDSKGQGIKEADLSVLGTAKKVIVTKDETIIIGGGGSKSELRNLLDELRMNLAGAKNEDEKFPIEKRIARLTGGVAVIQVGAATETEMKERLDRFDDSVRATKAAIAEGYVPGGGTSYIRCIGSFGSKKKNGVADMMNRVLIEPAIQISKNAGMFSHALIQHVANESGNIGYNVKTDRVEDLVAAGVIDPCKVLRCALQNAASAAGMILTSECVLADSPNGSEVVPEHRTWIGKLLLNLFSNVKN